MSTKFLVLSGLLIGSINVGQASPSVAPIVNYIQEQAKKQIEHASLPSSPNNPFQNNPSVNNTAIASSQTCEVNYYQSLTPIIVNQKLASNTKPLCFNGFAVMYSVNSRTALWSAEHLTKQRLNQARQLPREDSFHEEPRLSKNEQAYLSDYTNSGFDRGHLSPNADMADTNQQSDSFSLANIFPQAPELNRGAWADLEKDVRNQSLKYGESYVVTGIAFNGKNISSLKNRVLIPTLVYKAVYYPAAQKLITYYADNTADGSVKTIDPSELVAMTGVNPFPSLIHVNNRQADQAISATTQTIHQTENKSTNPDNKRIEWFKIGLAIAIGFFLLLMIKSLLS